jgi:hypothetical protein
VVESTLKEVLPEFLNAEVALRTIGDVSQAIDWLRSTYLYVRIQRAPGQYGVPRQLAPGGEALDRWLRDRLVLATVRELAEHGMVGWGSAGCGLEWAGRGQAVDSWALQGRRCPLPSPALIATRCRHIGSSSPPLPTLLTVPTLPFALLPPLPCPCLALQVRLHEDGFGLEPLQPGQIMAEKYVRMKTMVSLCSAPQGAAIPDLISILARWVLRGVEWGGVG